MQLLNIFTVSWGELAFGKVAVCLVLFLSFISVSYSGSDENINENLQNAEAVVKMLDLASGELEKIGESNSCANMAKFVLNSMSDTIDKSSNFEIILESLLTTIKGKDGLPLLSSLAERELREMEASFSISESADPSGYKRIMYVLYALRKREMEITGPTMLLIMQPLFMGMGESDNEQDKQIDIKKTIDYYGFSKKSTHKEVLQSLSNSIIGEIRTISFKPVISGEGGKPTEGYSLNINFKDDLDERSIRFFLNENDYDIKQFKLTVKNQTSITVRGTSSEFGERLAAEELLHFTRAGIAKNQGNDYNDKKGPEITLPSSYKAEIKNYFNKSERLLPVLEADVMGTTYKMKRNGLNDGESKNQKIFLYPGFSAKVFEAGSKDILSPILVNFPLRPDNGFINIFVDVNPQRFLF